MDYQLHELQPEDTFIAKRASCGPKVNCDIPRDVRKDQAYCDYLNSAVLTWRVQAC